MSLSIDARWFEPNFVPETLYDSPYVELPNTPIFEDVLMGVSDHSPWEGSLSDFAAALCREVQLQLAAINTPVHAMLSGGYDSRMLAFMLEAQGHDALYVTDGSQEPECMQTVKLLGIPESRVYVHDTSVDDPYSLAEATCDGYAPLYSQLRFTPPGKHPKVTLVNGLGGGEWFSYPASNWHRGKKRRLPHSNLVNMWMDCWPQYALLPGAWARPYGAALSPYCTVEYARVATRCHTEWLKETPGRPELDLVRSAMMDSLDSRLKEVGWAPHRYDWRLTKAQKKRIDRRFYDSSFGSYWKPDWGAPSGMHHANHACTIAGFSTWHEKLTA